MPRMMHKPAVTPNPAANPTLYFRLLVSSSEGGCEVGLGKDVDEIALASLVVGLSNTTGVVDVVTLSSASYITLIECAFNPSCDVVPVVVLPAESRPDITKVDVSPKCL